MACFFIFGAFVLDECGNFCEIIDFVPREHISDLPDVMTRDEMNQELKIYKRMTGRESTSLSWSFENNLPLARL